MKRATLMACSALCALSITSQPILAGTAPLSAKVVTQPDAHGIIKQMIVHQPHLNLSDRQMIALVRKKIKYVFVLYQENRSFDSYFGTFPGADGLYSKSPAKTPGFYQTLITPTGRTTTISPFRIGPKQYAWDTDDIDHSHGRTVAKMDVVNGVPRMDKFATTEELKYSPTGNPSLKAEQYGELAMAHEDCDTVPFLWRYASRFVLFDHVFEDVTGPSTPGNLSIFAAQTGLTQWALHPKEGFVAPNGTPYAGNAPPVKNAAGAAISESGSGEPVMDDDDPFWGSLLDPAVNTSGAMPVNPGDFTGTGPYGVQINQTYASLALSTAGRDIKTFTNQDTAPAIDLADVKQDIGYLAAHGQKPVHWGWFEEGYDHEPTDPANPVDANGTHASYITHHNGPQYFGYVANNQAERNNLHGAEDFFTAVQTGGLPSKGGVFYLKGGYANIMGMKVDNPVAKVRANFIGDDDHPGYSDAQISEAFIAKAVNAIAKSPYWKHSAIIITWDDSEGDYDHVRPPIVADGPDHLAFDFGPRVPLLVISPYARVHAISHEMGSQASVVKFVDAVFGLTPLALLPDEMKGRRLGEQEFGQPNIGPADALTPDVGDLMSAFDPHRLNGQIPLLPPSYAIIPHKEIMHLPQDNGLGCDADGIVPTDIAKGIKNHIPANFNPLPSTNPST
ncbi:MAG: alkaline phosphatase family protein [Acidiphilium sp.]|nr:alkaline phosphatase family protein [Acidiphilium sp.]MDD4935616.1 alkaline phosphatase family protein [Acidiphilium sp.]